MTELRKKFLKDKDGNRILPITHMKAVKDSQGNSLASVLGDFEDEVRGLVDTPHQEYVTVADYASLPASGSKDTIYRVSNYDGSTSQVDACVYSEYAWNGSQYIFLCVKSQIGEVFDISVYHNNATYADLNAALTGNTGGVPSSLQKGGMSVKFVQTDNKYVQCRLMADEFTTDTTQWAIAEEGVYVENPEFIYVKTDAKGKILLAIETDGGIYYGAGCPQQVKDYIEEKISSLSLDEYEDIVTFLSDYLGGDATLKSIIDIKVDKVAGKSLIDAEFAEGVSQIENPEFVEVHIDAKDKISYGVKKGGDFYFGAGIPSQIQKELDNIVELAETKVDKVTGKSLIDEGVSESQSTIEDPEGRIEIKTDAEGKVLSYRDTDGVNHENVGIDSKSIKTNSLNLTPDGMTEFQQALKDAGFQPGGAGNFSDSTFVELPIPTVCADVNIIPDSDVPITNVPIDGYIEYYDHLGNYFKKRISGFDIQGDSSKTMPYKNYKFDLDDDSKIKFGNWVPQDSFHLKKYYMDSFRGQCVVGYWLAEQMYQCREFENRKPYEYLYKNTSFMDSNGSMKEDFYTGALCHPDGFPIKLYYNGTLLGVYAFNLKKDKDNYAMKKTTTSHIILDGELYISNIWGGTVNWSAFEIRNPKPKKKKDGWELVDINGDTYDGDNPVELMGTTSPGYDSTNQSHKKSADVKAIIERLSGAINDINSAATTEQKKEKFETYFKVDECIDYFLFANMVYDNDGLGKNWIWCTWDGLIWSPTYYDKDSIFGLIPATGLGITENSTTTILKSNSISDPIGLVYNLYRDEVIERYNELKENNVFTKENIIGLLETWVSKIGYDNLKEELEESCPETPSYRTNNLYDGWLITGLENKTLPAFDSNHTYVEGERCWFLNMSLLATKTIEPHDSPIENPYSLYPYGGGFYNSIQRVYNWLNARFITLDNVLA